MTLVTDAPTRDATRAAEVTHKVDLVRAWAEEVGHAAVLLRSQSSFAWITGGGRSYISIGEEPGVASVLVTPRDVYVITTNIERTRLIDEELGDLPFEIVDHPWYKANGDRRAVSGLADPARTVVDLPYSDLATAGPGLNELRHTLLPSEQDRYRVLGLDAATAVENACRAAEYGESEHEVLARVAEACARRDILPLVLLAAADGRIASYRHPLPTSARAQRTLLVALTGRRHGLHASLTRMVSFGEPDLDLVARHRAVARIDAQMILASRPGVSLGRVLSGAIERYATAGYPGEWTRHHQGGPTGYAGREAFATPGSTYSIRESQAIAWNPSITRVKSEDTILVTRTGYDALTRTGSWPEVDASFDAGTVARPGIYVTES